MNEKLTPDEAAILIHARKILKSKGLPKNVTVTTICQAAGISRKTGYQWAKKVDDTGSMSQDLPRREDEQAKMLAFFRYGVIAPIVEADGLAYGQTRELIEALSAQSHFLPGKGPVVVKERTVYEWLRRYRQGGLDALLSRVRKDKGKGRVVDEQVVTRAIELRKENPQRCTSTLLDIMQREGTLDGKPVPHRSTLERHLSRRGMSRRQTSQFSRQSKWGVRFMQQEDVEILNQWRKSNNKKRWEKAVIILENGNLTLDELSSKIERPLYVIKKWIKDFNRHGLEGLEKPRKKHDNTKLQKKIDEKTK